MCLRLSPVALKESNPVMFLSRLYVLLTVVCSLSDIPVGPRENLPIPIHRLCGVLSPTPILLSSFFGAMAMIKGEQREDGLVAGCESHPD